MKTNDIKYRFRLKGYSVGQINTELWEQYKALVPYKKDTHIIQHIIENEILGHPCKTVSDIQKAEELVKNEYYGNIGEFIEVYVRNRLEKDFKICKNCNRYGICSKEPYAFQKMCR